MKILRYTAFSVIISSARGQAIPVAKTLTPPPSVALAHAPLPREAKIAFVVDEIPPAAKFVIYAQVTLDGVTLAQARAREDGDRLSRTLDQLNGLARERGANLIVLFSNEHGVDIPIRQCSAPLRLRAVNPVVTAVLFNCDLSLDSASWKNVRFTTKPTKAEGACINYSIEMVQDTAGITKAYWTYGNISRFVSDAVENHFDTIAFEDSSDTEAEEVWLPGSDEPVNISNKKPKLIVTIYKSKKTDSASQHDAGSPPSLAESLGSETPSPPGPRD